MTLKNNRAPLLSIIKLYVSFHHHMWIQTRVTVRKRLSWVLTSVTLTFDLWPWPFARTSLLSLVITPENFMMIRWWEHGEKGGTDRRDWTSHIAAWSQLKSIIMGDISPTSKPILKFLACSGGNYYNMTFKLKKDNQMSPKTWWHTVKYFLGKNSDQELPPDRWWWQNKFLMWRKGWGI